MLYFLCVSLGACVGFIICAMLSANVRADIVTTANADRLRADGLDKANGILRRELTELRLAYEPTRDHGYGLTNGR